MRTNFKAAALLPLTLVLGSCAVQPGTQDQADLFWRELQRSDGVKLEQTFPLAHTAEGGRSRAATAASPAPLAGG